MRFQRMTEQEAKAASTPEPLPEGQYDFEVIVADERNSKSSGLGMFELQLKVFTDDGKFRTIRDYIMVEGKAAWRLRQCCECLGLMLHYEREQLEPSDFEGTGGTCVLTIQRDPTGQYSPQNRVKSYLPAKGARPHPPVTFKSLSGNTAEARKREPVPAGDLDDEIPF